MWKIFKKIDIHYERDKLHYLGHPELAELVQQVSKKDSNAGYEARLYEINDDRSFTEIHIEVKSAGKYSFCKWKWIK